MRALRELGWPHFPEWLWSEQAEFSTCACNTAVQNLCHSGLALHSWACAYRMPPQKDTGHTGSQNTPDYVLMVGGLHQWLWQKAKWSPQGEVTSACRLVYHETLELGIKARAAKQPTSCSGHLHQSPKWHQRNRACLRRQFHVLYGLNTISLWCGTASALLVLTSRNRFTYCWTGSRLVWDMEVQEVKGMCAHLLVLPELFSMEGASGSHLCQPLAQSRINSEFGPGHSGLLF